jgi:xenotropic and polytropic retrovirus receptor 1
MLLGFFTCLPGIWRALQCLRRYRDSKMAFPHLANCGKYICTILFYMSLSLYRLDRSTTKLAIFIAFATINSIYVSIWDILIDWSLGIKGERALFFSGQSSQTQRFGFPKYAYYPAVVVDPLLRFNWIFYVIFTGELQHSALLSFFVSLSEIFRRAFWALFRVENEHMTNVGMFRASKDIPLPYDTSPSRESTEEPGVMEAQAISTPRRVGTALAGAHIHDFERRKPTVQDSDDDDDDDDDEDDDEEEEVVSSSQVGGPS